MTFMCCCANHDENLKNNLYDFYSRVYEIIWNHMIFNFHVFNFNRSHLCSICLGLLLFVISRYQWCGFANGQQQKCSPSCSSGQQHHQSGLLRKSGSLSTQRLQKTKRRAPRKTTINILQNKYIYIYIYIFNFKILILHCYLQFHFILLYWIYLIQVYFIFLYSISLYIVIFNLSLMKRNKKKTATQTKQGIHVDQESRGRQVRQSRHAKLCQPHEDARRLWTPRSHQAVQGLLFYRSKLLFLKQNKKDKLIKNRNLTRRRLGAKRSTSSSSSSLWIRRAAFARWRRSSPPRASSNPTLCKVAIFHKYFVKVYFLLN